MSRENFGWSLPPGVTSKMIEDAQGGDHGWDRIECAGLANDEGDEGCGWEEVVWSEDVPDCCPECCGEVRNCGTADPPGPDPDDWVPR